MENVNAKVQGTEKFINPANGWFILFTSLIGTVACIALPIAMLSNGHSDWWGLMFIGALVFIVLMCGLFVVNPNESTVITFFGKYEGTVIKNGFFYYNPFASKKEHIIACKKP